MQDILVGSTQTMRTIPRSVVGGAIVIGGTGAGDAWMGTYRRIIGPPAAGVGMDV